MSQNVKPSTSKFSISFIRATTNHLILCITVFIWFATDEDPLLLQSKWDQQVMAGTSLSLLTLLNQIPVTGQS